MAQASLKVTLLTGLLPAFLLMAPALQAAEPGAVNNAVVQQESVSKSSKYNPISWFKRKFTSSADKQNHVKQVAHSEETAQVRSSQTPVSRRPTLGRRSASPYYIQQVSNQPNIITSTPAPFERGLILTLNVSSVSVIVKVLSSMALSI